MGSLDHSRWRVSVPDSWEVGPEPQPPGAAGLAGDMADFEADTNLEVALPSGDGVGVGHCWGMNSRTARRVLNPNLLWCQRAGALAWWDGRGLIGAL